MENMFAELRDWFFGLGATYGVDPLVFGVIYVGAIPFFIASISWLVRSLRAKKSIVFPVLSAGFFFISAYLYLAIVGHDLPVWVWIALGLFVVYGFISTIRSVRKRMKE